jgi:hypothetical protein
MIEENASQKVASIKDERASKVGPAGIDIAYQRLGRPMRRPRC